MDGTFPAHMSDTDDAEKKKQAKEARRSAEKAADLAAIRRVLCMSSYDLREGAYQVYEQDLGIDCVWRSNEYGIVGNRALTEYVMPEDPKPMVLSALTPCMMELGPHDDGSMPVIEKSRWSDEEVARFRDAIQDADEKACGNRYATWRKGKKNISNGKLVARVSREAKKYMDEDSEDAV